MQKKTGKNNLIRRTSAIIYAAVLTVFAVLTIAGNPMAANAEETEMTAEAGIQVKSYYGYTEEELNWPHEYEAEVFRFLSMVDEDWSDVQKLVFLHDYLVTRCDYNFAGLKDAKELIGQYGVLCKSRGICSDYSAAFNELAYRMGIRTKSVHCQAMNHEWNLAQLDGEWFFVDCTWDDPGYQNEEDSMFKMFCDHRFLIKSEEAFYHGGTDWYSDDEDGERRSAYGIYHNTAFDSACWSDSISPVVVLKDGYLVLKKNGKIYRSDSNGNNAVQIATVDNPWTYGTITSKGDYVFVNNRDTVFQLDVSSGNLTAIYTLSAAEKEQYGSIYGIEADGSFLRYDMAKGPAKGHYLASGRLNLENLIGPEIKGNSLSEDALTFYKAGTKYSLHLLDYSGKTITADSWSSSDSSVASVGKSGTVTAVGYGKTVITATKDGKKYHCVVAFDTTWQNDYDYGIWEGRYRHSEYIYLDRYSKTEMEENIVIPAVAYVGGERFKTAVRNACFTVYLNGSTRMGTKLYPSNDVIQSITFEKGVIFEENGYGAFGSCSKLRSIDFGGLDFSGCPYTVNILYYCENLEFVNLSGCRFNNTQDEIDLLSTSSGVKRILTPDYIREGLSIPLAVPLRVKNADGTYGSEIIRDLADAPVGAELVSLEDTTWQNDYEYHISSVYDRKGKYLCLDRYIGSEENVYVPKLAIADGKEYPVCLRGAVEAEGGMRTTSLFPSNAPVVTFAVEEGVIVDSYYCWYIFSSNGSVREIDFQGCDFSKTKTFYQPFYNAYNLEKISFKGCNLGVLSNAPNFFTYCSSLKEIITPDVIADGISIDLPVPMYEKNEDGTTKDTAYTKLEDAPRGCTLVSEKKDTPDCRHNLTHVKAVAASCTADGNCEYWFCSKCGCYYADADAKTEIEQDGYVIKATGHDYHAVPGSAKEAGCTEDGKEADFKCSRCGDVQTGAVVEKLGHNWDDGVITKEATEAEEGVKTFTCTRCHLTRTEVIPKAEHVHNLIHVKEAKATCLESGNTEYWYCVKCERYYADSEAKCEIAGESTVLAPLGHDYREVPDSAKAAGCTEAGKEADQKCSRCEDEIKGKETAPLGHLWNSGVITKEPTEEEEGEKTFTCGRCQEKRTESIPKKDHIHSLLHVEAKTADCTEPGNAEYWYCEKCDSYFSDETAENKVLRESLVLPALGHAWNNGEVIKNPTEEEEGIRKYTCTRCTKSYTETIPKMIHVHNLIHVEATQASCLESGNTEYWYCVKCERCYTDPDAACETEKAATVLAPLGHRWDQGVITKEPTMEEEGEKTYTCERCKETRREPIDKLDRKDRVTEIFTDIPETAWYVNAVQYAYDHGFMSGKGDKFDPNGTLKREEFVQILYGLSGKPAVSSHTNPFKDVKEGKWYTDAVLWAYGKGYAAGNSDGTFGIGKNIQRQALVSMMYKYAEANGYDMSYDVKALEGYKDTEDVSDWAKTSFGWAVSKGIISGKAAAGETDKSKIKLDPAGNATRSECAAMMMKFLQSQNAD